MGNQSSHGNAHAAIGAVFLPAIRHKVTQSSPILVSFYFGNSDVGFLEYRLHTYIVPIPVLSTSTRSPLPSNRPP